MTVDVCGFLATQANARAETLVFSSARLISKKESGVRECEH